MVVPIDEEENEGAEIVIDNGKAGSTINVSA